MHQLQEADVDENIDDVNEYNENSSESEENVEVSDHEIDEMNESDEILQCPAGHNLQEHQGDVEGYDGVPGCDQCPATNLQNEEFFYRCETC